LSFYDAFTTSGSADVSEALVIVFFALLISSVCSAVRK